MSVLIDSNGGGDTGAVSLLENLRSVTTVHATTDTNSALSYSIAGGDDAALFSIDPVSGALSFAAAPNYEAPADVGANNIYDVIVRANDGTGHDDQALAVSVLNIIDSAELSGPVYPAPGGNSFSGSGSSGRDSGQSRSYAGFDSGHYDNIYWGLTNIRAAMDGAVDSPAENLTFQGISANGLTATWTGSTNAPGYGGAIFTRLTVTINPGASGTAHWITSDSLGYSTGPVALVDVDESIGSLAVNVAYQAATSAGGPYDSFLDVYDAITTAGGGAITSSSGLFYAHLINQPPVLTGSQAVLTHASEDVAYTVSGTDLLAGYTDANGDTLTATGVFADHGSVTANLDGSFTIAPAANYNGGVTLSYSITDGHGGTTGATLGYTIDPVNDAPILLLDGSSANVNASYTENSGAIPIAPNATVSDIDSVNFDGGVLNVGFATNETEGVLGIRDSGIGLGDIGVSGNQVSYEGTNIATFSTSGSPGANVVIFFDNGVSVEAAQALVRAITYENPSQNPSPNSHVIEFVLMDGDGNANGGSDTAYSFVGLSVVPVNDAPTGGVTIAGTVATGQTLTAANTLADADGLGLIGYQWLLDGSPIGGATGGSFTVRQSDIGHTISVSASYIDGGGTHESVTSGTTAPVVQGAGSFTGSGSSETLTGSNFDDTLSGLAGNDTLRGLDGNDVLLGGAGNDLIDGGAGNDTASYADATAGVKVDLQIAVAQSTVGGGKDTLVGIENLTGSNFADTLTGNGGDNVLTGGGGGDKLFGNGGNDRLNGGAGIDLLNGGGGSDTFVFALLTTSAQHDTIQDFVTGTDRIELSASAFVGLAGFGPGQLDPGELSFGTKATTADQHLIYNSATGALIYDADGLGGMAGITIAVLAGHAALTASDIYLI